MDLKRIAVSSFALAVALLPLGGAHAGSLLPTAEKFTAAGAADTTQVTKFSIYLPLSHQTELDQLLADQVNPASPRYRVWLTPEQFTERFGPSREALNKAEKIIRAAGLTLVEEWSQGITVQGTVGQVNAFFGTRLEKMAGEHGNTRLVAPRGLNLPGGLKDIDATVPHFAPTPVKHINSLVRIQPGAIKPGQREGAFGATFYFDDLKQAYGYPSYTVLNGKGTTIALVMSAAAQQSDLDQIFDEEKFSTLSGANNPTFTNVSVDGASTVFDLNNGATDEVSLDTQMSLGSAPGATGIVYVLPDLSDQSILDGYALVIKQNKADVVSSSFGGCELFYQPAYNGGTDYTSVLKKSYKNLIKQGNAQGITFVASSGDEAATGCGSPASLLDGTAGDFTVGVEAPAALPNMTGVGGTNLETYNTINSSNEITLDAIYDYELAWGDPLIPFDYYGTGAILSNGMWGSGGGVSQIFAAPAYQSAVSGTGKRAVPDISMHMGGCPGGIAATCHAGDSAVVVAIGGEYGGLIGTSASSPEFAGVVALLVEHEGKRVGNVNSYIYARAAGQQAAGGVDAPADKQFFHRVIPGYNNKYSSAHGEYSKVLGVGTPQVANFLKLPQGTALAGTPQTASNP
jgi:subtilase family serine protease